MPWGHPQAQAARTLPNPLSMLGRDAMCTFTTEMSEPKRLRRLDSSAPFDSGTAARAQEFGTAGALLHLGNLFQPFARSESTGGTTDWSRALITPTGPNPNDSTGLNIDGSTEVARGHTVYSNLFQRGLIMSASLKATFINMAPISYIVGILVVVGKIFINSTEGDAVTGESAGGLAADFDPRGVPFSWLKQHPGVKYGILPAADTDHQTSATQHEDILPTASKSFDWHINFDKLREATANYLQGDSYDVDTHGFAFDTLAKANANDFDDDVNVWLFAAPRHTAMTNYAGTSATGDDTNNGIQYEAFHGTDIVNVVPWTSNIAVQCKTSQRVRLYDPVQMISVDSALPDHNTVI